MLPADRHGVALIEPAVRRDVAHAGHTHAQPLRGEAIEQELVGLVRALDGDAAELLLELGRAAGVIEVAMGEDDLLEASCRSA